MKKHICECGCCRKTATVKIRNGHRICEDHAKEIRRLIRSGRDIRGFCKEVLVGHVGEFDVCTDVFVKL